MIMSLKTAMRKYYEKHWPEWIISKISQISETN